MFCFVCLFMFDLSKSDSQIAIKVSNNAMSNKLEVKLNRICINET